MKKDVNKSGRVGVAVNPSEVSCADVQIVSVLGNLLETDLPRRSKKKLILAAVDRCRGWIARILLLPSSTFSSSS